MNSLHTNLCFMNKALARCSNQQVEEKPWLVFLRCTVFLLHSMFTLLVSQTNKNCKFKTLNFMHSFPLNTESITV